MCIRDRPYRTGGLEKDNKTGAISTDGPNHELMVLQRHNKIQHIAEAVSYTHLDVYKRQARGASRDGYDEAL